MILKLLERLGRKRVIKNGLDEDYMYRYYPLFKEKINAFDDDKTTPNVFIHKIIKSDADGDSVLHDHPWWYLTIVLAGGYYEWRPYTSSKGVTIQKRYWIGPGSILWRRAESLHRLELYNNTPALTIFIHGKRIREWGFLTKNGWVDRISYIKKLSHK
jgi:hypothetical protein